MSIIITYSRAGLHLKISDVIISGMYDEKKLLARLEEMGIVYKYMAHAAVYTSEQANQVNPHMHGTHCKNLFVKDKTNQKWLMTILDDRRVDLKRVAQIIGSHRLSFCNPTELWDNLGVTPGSVTPLAVVNDSNKNVKLYIDIDVMARSAVSCHPMANTATITLSNADFRRFIESTDHELNIASLAI